MPPPPLLLISETSTTLYGYSSNFRFRFLLVFSRTDKQLVVKLPRASHEFHLFASARNVSMVPNITGTVSLAAQPPVSSMITRLLELENIWAFQEASLKLCCRQENIYPSGSIFYQSSQNKAACNTDTLTSSFPRHG